MTEKKKSVFIVDDNMLNIQALAKHLKDRGYDIAFASGGKEAIDYLQKYSFDLILLDIAMPEMDGFELCDRIKADEALKDIPIIFLTARTDEEAITEAFKRGGVDYITKPFNANEVLARVETHINLKQKNEALKEIVATKDKLFSIIAHDLKNPLSTFIGLGNLLDTKPEKYSVEDIKRIGSMIYTSGKQASYLLENLLDWSRLQLGTLDVSLRTIDIKGVLAEVLALLDATAKKKNITFVNLIITDVRIYADTMMIATVLRNIINNAIKFSYDNSEIRISASNDNTYVYLSIQDFGVGIQEKKLSQLFDIAKINTSKGTHEEKGSGLGLILCKELMDMQKGTITIKSEPGKGSTVTIKIRKGR